MPFLTCERRQQASVPHMPKIATHPSPSSFSLAAVHLIQVMLVLAPIIQKEIGCKRAAVRVQTKGPSSTASSSKPGQLSQQEQEQGSTHNTSPLDCPTHPLSSVCSGDPQLSVVCSVRSLQWLSHSPRACPAPP